VQVNVLGPVEIVTEDGSRIPVAPQRRVVLAALALELNRVVSVERLIDVIWGQHPPQHARTMVHGDVSALRRVLGGGLSVVTRAPGYTLEADPERVDAHRFTALVAAAVAQTKDEGAVLLFREALALWRGPALADLTGNRLAQGFAAPLEDARVSALEGLAERLCRTGEPAEAVALLRDALGVHPLRESLATQLVVCLHQTGQTAAALAVFDAVRRRLAEDLGMDPGAALCAAHETVLRSKPPRSGGSGSSAPWLVAPAQLPREAAGFVGRADDLARMGEWHTRRASMSSILMLDGPAGVGKTALALRWAHRVAGEFTDGQLFVNLRGWEDGDPLDPGQALGSLLRALGVPADQIPAASEDRATLYRSVLADRNVLVVLDNAHDSTQVHPLVPGSPRCRVLVTSRRRLGALAAQEGADTISLGPLAPDDAIALLVGPVDTQGYLNTVGTPRTAGNAATPPGAAPGPAVDSAAARVARLCDYLPLALRIAASQLRAHPQRSVARLAEELAIEQSRLGSLATDDAELSVAAALAATCRRLTAEQLHVLTFLGVHPHPEVEAHAAAALADRDLPATRRTLAALAACHLLQETAPERYARHDLIRLYSRQLADRELTAQSRAAALGRLLDHYLRVTGRAARLTVSFALSLHEPSLLRDGDGPQLTTRHDAASWFEREEPVIRALALAALAEDPNRVWRLVANTSVLYDSVGNADHWAHAASIGLQAAQTAGDTYGRMRMNGDLGLAVMESGSPHEALRHLEQAVGLLHPSMPLRDRFNAHNWLASGYKGVGRLDQALAQCRSTLALARQLGEPVAQALALNNLGHLSTLQGDPERALDYTRQAIDLLPAGQRKGTYAQTLHTRAWALRELGSVDEARTALVEAADLFRTLGRTADLADALDDLAALLEESGRPGDASVFRQEARDLHTRLHRTHLAGRPTRPPTR
jgi:DNA-binding SARP family transcriptional activator/tetratricopeptide (TPR) repeat protein